MDYLLEMLSADCKYHVLAILTFRIAFGTGHIAVEGVARWKVCSIMSNSGLHSDSGFTSL